jgi:UDP-N-acetylglucosamine 2-epimerase
LSRARTFALCYGTRPQIIKASRLAPALAAGARVVRIDTGQHYDYALNALLYAQLGVAPPDRFLEVGSGPAAEQTAAVLTRAAQAFSDIKPDAVVVIGDTISTLGAGLAAALLRIPVVHVEAGLRASASGFLEETSRRVVDHLSAVLCAPCPRAAAALRSEGVRGAVHVTGDVAYDVLRESVVEARARFRAAAWPIAPDQPFVLATLHRAELVDVSDRLRRALAALRALRYPVLFPVHPRTRARLVAFDLLPLAGGAVHFVDPMGYLETVGCIEAASAVVTDSGGVQREAYWLGTPCVTIREETEWGETIDAGANRLIVPDHLPDALAAAVDEAVAGTKPGSWARTAFGEGDAAKRITDAIEVLT